MQGERGQRRAARERREIDVGEPVLGQEQLLEARAERGEIDPREAVRRRVQHAQPTDGREVERVEVRVQQVQLDERAEPGERRQSSDASGFELSESASSEGQRASGAKSIVASWFPWRPR